MKKTILFALIAVGLTVSFFVGISMSQDRRSVRIQTPEGLTLTVYPVEDRDVQTQRLRVEILKLIEQRLQSMNEAELQKELSEHEANSKLQQAEKILQEILKTYPKSKAAKQARIMLGTQ